MTDDPADRMREQREGMAQKARWLAELSARMNPATGAIDAEAAAEARKAAGIHPSPEPRQEEE